MRHLIIILAVFLSSCSYFQRGHLDKQSVDKNSIAFIEIQRHCYDSSIYKLNEKQISGFIENWNSSKEVGFYKFIPNIRITLHLKNGETRVFRANTSSIIENSGHCYSVADSNYFGQMWAEAVSYTLNDAFIKVTKEKFLEQVKKLENGLKLEIVDLYEDSENISSYENLYIGEYLKKNGFEVTHYGRGNWFLGPIIENETLENKDYKCTVDKLYYSQDSTKKYKITERIECVKK